MFARAIKSIDHLNRTLGHAVAWLALAMVLLQFSVVVLRYVFSVGYVPMQEAVWHLHGLLFLLGAGYTLLSDGHVRVDVIYRDASPAYKARTDLAGCLFFVLPVCILTLFVSWDYVLRAIYDFESGIWVLERSPEFGGLPLVWAYKAVIWVFAATLALQAISMAGKALSYLLGRAATYPPDLAKGGERT
ncbi:MAG: TRAP transporter small permease subunit [Pseudomonadota bacterium]